MADKFSAQWWNDQAAAAGGLDKAAVESLTGQSFPVVWNADGSIDWDKAWPKNAQISAPGLGAAGLLLDPTPKPASYPYATAEDAFAARDPNWGGWARLKSAVGVVAPGANAPWQPELTPTYTPPTPTTTVAAPPDNPVTQGGGATPVTAPAPAPAGAPGSDGTTSKLGGGSATFTGGETQPGGGGEVSGSSGVMGGVRQTATPGSIYTDLVDDDDQAPAPAGGSSSNTAGGFTGAVLIVGLVFLALVVFAVVAKRRVTG